MKNELLVKAITILLALGLGTSVADPGPEGQPYPKIKLTKGAKGREIPMKLGADFAAVAAHHGKTEAELRKVCNRDQDLRVDRQGRLFYSCAGLAAGAAPAQGAGVGAGPFPYQQTFQLHSRAGATKVIYLDFDGHTTTGTFWNVDYTGGNPIVTPPYDIDSNPGSFSNAEMDNIQRIWQRVSEDFAAYEVDVTTADPGVENLRKTSPGDVNYGIRVCIGGSCFDWLGWEAGGIAYVDSFDWDTDTPVFVFPAQLGNGAEKYVAEASSHETGHSFGLGHDGDLTPVEYYAGHADWAPIMGNSYYKAVTQFSQGEYNLASNQEDDLAMIANYVPYRADQHGDVIASATPLPAGANPSAGGVIETRADVDMFSFTTAAGNISFVADPAAPEANLNIRLALYNGAGNLITSADPLGMASTLNANVGAGTYYIAVEGVGTGAPDVAYNDYGSIGQFSLSGTVVLPGNQPPVAVATNSAPLSGPAPLTVNFSSVGSYDPDGSIVSYDWDFGDGQTSAAQNPAHAYAAAGNYTASLVVFDNLGLSGQTTVNVTVTPVGLPPPWLDIDVGTTGAAGSASYNGGAYTISGAGVGFLKDGIADNFNFAYQTLTNDGSITVRLNTLQNTGANARVGVVIRETLAPNSRSAFMGVTGASGFLWVSRANAGAKATVTTSGTGAAPNIWLRLVRLTDGTIEGYKSTNGTTWTKVKTLKVTTPQVYIGLAVSSGTSGVRNTSVFNSVTVVP